MDQVIGISVMLTLSAAPPPPQLTLADPVAVESRAAWPGEDKFRHAGMSWATTVFAYAAARSFDQDADAALTIALPVTAAIGLGKEIRDARGGGRFSARDLVADAVGAAAAWLFLREVQ